MRQFIAKLTAALAAALVLCVQPAAGQTFPELTGRVVDNADLLDPAEEAALEARLEALETQSQRQLVVATIPDLEGYDISDYGYQLGREWGLGDAERNDGAILLVAPNDRKVRIEVGYGLEPVLTDGLSGLIVQQQILPRFREGDFAGGIAVGVDSIVEQLQLPEEEARAIAAQADERQQRDGGFPIGALIWFAVLLFFFILPMLGKGGRRRRRRGGMGGMVGNIILWEAANAIARGASGGGGSHWGGGGGFGSSGGFGGGFSGGGGSFGGGGASGGW